MTDSSERHSRRIALDSNAQRETRLAAIRDLAGRSQRGSVTALIELGSRPEESAWVLMEAGFGLARLQDGGATISEWDIRDLTVTAADAFFSS